MAEQMMTPNPDLASRLASVRYLDVDANRTTSLGRYDAAERKVLLRAARGGGTPVPVKDAFELIYSFGATTKHVAEIDDPTLIEDLFSWVEECKGPPIDEIATALTEGVEALVNEHLYDLSDAHLGEVNRRCMELDKHFDKSTSPAGMVAYTTLLRRNQS